MNLNTMHFVSSGDEFPYYYYLAVMSASKTQKGNIILWVKEHYDDPYFKKLGAHVEIRRIKDAFFLKEASEYIENAPIMKEIIDPHVRAVNTFDYLIWTIMSSVGGIFAGLSSIFFDDISELWDDSKEFMVGIDDAKNRPQFMSPCGSMWRPDSEVCNEIMQAIKNNSQQQSYNYRWGDLGITPAQEIMYKHRNKGKIYDWGMLSGHRLDEGRYYLLEDDAELLHPDAKASPWYAASYKWTHQRGYALADVIDSTWIKESNSLYAKIIKEQLEENEI